MATEYGVWSNIEDGFVKAGLYSWAEAAQAVRDMNHDAGITPDSADAADLTVREICPDHDEQPRDTCEECFAEED